MKRMSEKGKEQPRLKERLLNAVGDGFIKMAADSPACTLFMLYEPEIPHELLKEMSAKKKIASMAE
jgi:cyclic lactone autoinducer peptide